MSAIRDVLLQLLFSLMPFVMYNVYYRNMQVNYSKSFILIACSLCLLLSMTFPSSIVPGLIFDVRYVIIFFGLLFGGLVTGFVLLAEFLCYRIYIGGTGLSDAVIIMLITFPLSLLFRYLYHHLRQKHLITFLAGLSFFLVPLSVLYATKPGYIMEHFSYNLLVLPAQNMLGIWLLVTLFTKSVNDKDLYLKVILNEKANAISQVAASLAHEVRNPLTSVLGFLKLIRSKRFPPEKIDHFIEISIDEIERTEQIISEYLSISKPLGSFRQQIDLVSQVKTVVEVMTPYANMNNVTLASELPPAVVVIFANAAEMKQLLVNFVKNAIEACGDTPHGRVNILMRIHSESVQLDIRDNGIGMDASQIARLGSIYYSTKSNGTGLGLTFSYQAIRSLNGTVSVSSQPLAGTTFTIMIPLCSS